MSRYIRKLSELFFETEGDRAAFEGAFATPLTRPQGVVWVRERPITPLYEESERVPWQPAFVDRTTVEGLGATPEHSRGDFYLLDMASVFSAAAIADRFSSGGVLLDVCAAPGGKSVLLHRITSPRVLFCNEAIGSRLPMLISNIKRCALSPVGITSCDPKVISTLFKDSADTVVVDAPCSGQALVARGEGEAGSFHPTVVRRNAMRQRRILALAAETVRPGGILLYMTCTFSPEENEEVVEWFLSKHRDFTPEVSSVLKGNESPLTPLPLYRIWPHKGVGAGGSVTLLRRQGSVDSAGRALDIDSLPLAWKSGL